MWAGRARPDANNSENNSEDNREDNEVGGERETREDSTDHKP